MSPFYFRMNYLLIDIGNTRIKCSLSVKGRMGRSVSSEYLKHKFKNSFDELIKKYSGLFDELYISTLDRKYKSIIKSKVKNCKVNFVNSKSLLPVKIDYANSLGSDRICSAVGAFKKFPEYNNLLVIDMGTATTFNIVSNGVFRGGMISAGLKTASEGLLKKTTLPNVVLNSKIELLNKTTRNGIISGLVFQQVFFIEKVIEEYKKMFKNLFVVVTGGVSLIIGKKVEGVNKNEPYLVLEGLNQIALYNQKIK